MIHIVILGVVRRNPPFCIIGEGGLCGMKCSGYYGFLVEAKPSFLEADVALPADDYMVKHLDVEEPACLYDLLRYLDVLWAWCRVS